MTRPATFRAKILLIGASLLLQLPSCASSQMDQSAEHPASPEAPVAPLPAVGEALSTDVHANPGPNSASPGVQSHGEHAQPTTSSAGIHDTHDGAMQHGGHAAPQPAPTAGGHANHGTPSSASQQAGEQWTCPMHPEVIQSAPGKCPKCGMKLVPAQPKPSP